MLRKKNYKQQDHFTQYYTFSVPMESGRKIIVYYKRYRPKLASADKVGQIYDMINANKNKQAQKKALNQGPFPMDRTLELMTFDTQLKGIIEQILKKIGKIRKFQFGKGEFKGREVFFCLAVFKYEFDLVKCFRQQFIQAIIQQQFKFHQNQQDKEDYRAQIIEKYLKTELQSKTKKIKQLHDEGYNLITNKTGQFKVDREMNQKWVEDLPQVKKQKKLEAKLQDTLKTKLQ